MTTTLRNRSRTLAGPKTNLVQNVRDYRGNGIFVNTGSPYNSTIMHSFETMVDQVDPQWQQKRAEGEVVINPVSHTKTTNRTRGYGRYQWTRTNLNVYREEGPGLTHFKIGTYPGYMQAVPAEPVPNADLGASAKLQALGNVDKSPYSFAEDIAELRETFRFLRDPVGNLRKLANSATKDRRKIDAIKHRKKQFDALVDLYLQYQFALSPLVRSVHDLIESFMEADRKRSDRRTANGKAEFSDSRSVHGVKFTWESSASISVEKVCRAGIIYEHSNPIYDWQWKYGLRFKDIPETLWAIFPYSFMVDRVWNLSQSIRGLNAFLDPNVKMLGGWTSTKKTTVKTRTWLNHVSSIVKSIDYATPDDYIEEVVQYDREVWTPVMSDLIPPTRLDQLADTATKTADVFALLWAAFRRGR